MMGKERRGGRAGCEDRMIKEEGKTDGKVEEEDDGGESARCCSLQLVGTLLEITLITDPFSLR